MPPTLHRLVLMVLVLAVALTGCASGSSPAAGPRPTATSEATDVTPSPSSVPLAVIPGPLARCGPQPQDVATAPFAYGALKDPDVGTIPTVTIGRGRTVAVLLHQTDGYGLCGWLPFSRDLARAGGVTALAIDLCRYGRSRCTKVDNGTFTAKDQVDAVALAVRHARETLHARRVVVVGASMGGSVALISGSRLPEVDAVVDLSGPVEWVGMGAVADGRALRVPVLAAAAPEEGKPDVDTTRSIVGNAPAGSRFVEVDQGHGYELLNNIDGSSSGINEIVREWIQGPQPGPGTT